MKNFVVYKSSAGSGKTFTLVKEYVRLALSDEKKLRSNYKHILALTFTNKAAAEMKSRVIDVLSKITQQESPTETANLLCQELSVSAAELKRRSSILLSDILHHYSDFSIGTIDSFTHKIIKTFAHDLQLPVNFNIEMDTKGFYEKVVDTLFSKVGEDEYISKLLTEYALSKARDNAAWDPQQQIQEFSDLLLKENSDLYLEKLKQFRSEELEGFRKQFLDFIQDYQNHIQEEAETALHLIEKTKLKDEDFVQKSNGPHTFFKKCLEKTVSLEHTKSKTLLAVLSNGEWAHKAGKNKVALDKIAPDLQTILVRLVTFIEENYGYYTLCKILSKQMYPLMLLKKIEEISTEQKAEDRLVFISEFNQKISEIIHHEPTPFIYERLGERYHHYLLDEFQDTSSMQWHNILPLLDNSLANGWMNLIVGDGKQSIYRWRNADVKQFAALPFIENKDQSEIIEERQQSLKRNYRGDVLNTNFRSLETMVRFNNTLFDDLSASLLSESSQKIYADQKQEIKNTEEGFVSIHTGKKTKEEIEPFNLQLVSEQISSAIADGFDYKDICIICRVKRSGSLIANYLMDQKIPVVSSDSLLLETNLEVNTIISYLRYLYNKQDQINAAAVINYLFQSGQINESDFHVYLSELSHKRTLSELLNNAGIALKEEELSLNNLFDNCLEIIHALKLTIHGYQYIRFFLDEVNEYLVLKNSSSSSFFDWWENRRKNASMIIPDNTNAVKIMTIHTSKGLEFPVVIVPFCSWPIYKAGDSWVELQSEHTALPVSIINLSKKAGEIGFEEEYTIEKQDQLLDNLNLMYVAFTRAVERLHIVCAYSTTINYESVAQWLEKHLEKTYAPVSENYYELGSLKKKWSKHSSKSLPDYQLEALAFPSSSNVIQLKASYLNNSPEAQDAQQEGLMIHWLLSKIKTVEDIDLAIELALLEGLTEFSKTASLKKKLLELCTFPQIADYFSPGTLCKLEAELINSQGEILRPDRIVFKEKETILMDYKTGKENNKVYFNQLLKYEQALHSMGYPSIKKLLVYVNDLKVVSVN